MLESEAKKKICPIMTRVVGGDPMLGPIFCFTSGCMMWEEWKIPDKSSPTTVPRKYVSRDPPAGDCGLKPPEMNCNYG